MAPGWRWYRVRPGLYRALFNYGEAIVERGSESGLWWWIVYVRGATYKPPRAGRCTTLARAKKEAYG